MCDVTYIWLQRYLHFMSAATDILLNSRKNEVPDMNQGGCLKEHNANIECANGDGPEHW